MDATAMKNRSDEDVTSSVRHLTTKMMESIGARRCKAIIHAVIELGRSCAEEAPVRL